MTIETISRLRGKWAHLRTVAALGSALLCLGGCAPGPQLVTTALQAPSGSGGSVCVLSVVGKTYALQRVGVTVFGNSHDTVDVTAWGLDEMIAREIAAATGGRIATRSIPVSIADPAQIVEHTSASRGPFTQDNPAWESEKRKAAADPSCAAVLTVTAWSSQVGGTNQFISGIGLLETQGPFFTEGKTFAHALLGLHLYEARTLKHLTWASTHPGPKLFADLIRGPHREVDNSWRIQKDAVRSSQQHRKAAEDLIREALASVVPQVLSTGKAPTSSPRATGGQARGQPG